MEEIKIIIENIPTKFIKTKNYGNLNYNLVINTILKLIDDIEEEWRPYDLDYTICEWLIDQKLIYLKYGERQSRWIAVCGVEENMVFDRKHNYIIDYNKIPLKIFYDKITEHERILNKLIGE